jgi:RimJ/RimL family protein N-acetyltransferase
VAEKAGFTREGVLRSYMEFNGRRRDGVMYSLLRQDPRPQTLRRSG